MHTVPAGVWQLSTYRPIVVHILFFALCTLMKPGCSVSFAITLALVLASGGASRNQPIHNSFHWFSIPISSPFIRCSLLPSVASTAYCSRPAPLSWNPRANSQLDLDLTFLGCRGLCQLLRKIFKTHRWRLGCVRFEPRKLTDWCFALLLQIKMTYKYGVVVPAQYASHVQ